MTAWPAEVTMTFDLPRRPWHEEPLKSSAACYSRLNHDLSRSCRRHRAPKLRILINIFQQEKVKLMHVVLCWGILSSKQCQNSLFNTSGCKFFRPEDVANSAVRYANHFYNDCYALWWSYAIFIATDNKVAIHQVIEGVAMLPWTLGWGVRKMHIRLEGNQ